MGFKLQIVFTGLCVFVPDITFESNASNTMLVLLPDGRHPGYASTGQRLLTHVAAMKFEGTDLDPDYRDKIDCLYKREGEDSFQNFWIFNGDDLRIKDGNTDIVYTQLQIDPEFRFKIPYLKEIYSNSNGWETDPKYLDQTGLDCGLVARLKLGKGHLNVDPEHYAGVQKFEGERGEIKRPFFNGAIYETDIVSDYAIIYSHQGTELKFRPEVAGEDVTIFIDNSPPELIWAKNGNSPDVDFEMIYRVGKPSGRRLRIPSRAEESPRPLLCSMAILNPDTLG